VGNTCKGSRARRESKDIDVWQHVSGKKKKNGGGGTQGDSGEILGGGSQALRREKVEEPWEVGGDRTSREKPVEGDVDTPRPETKRRSTIIEIQNPREIRRQGIPKEVEGNPLKR